MQFDESPSFLDLDTGEVETVSRHLLVEAEKSADDEVPDLPLRQKPEWEIAKRIVSTNRFRKLPSKLKFTNGRLWRISRTRYRPIGLAMSCCAPFMAGGIPKLQGCPPAAPDRTSLV
jgi:hypothetical protein